LYERKNAGALPELQHQQEQEQHEAEEMEVEAVAADGQSSSHRRKRGRLESEGEGAVGEQEQARSGSSKRNRVAGNHASSSRQLMQPAAHMQTPVQAQPPARHVVAQPVMVQQAAGTLFDRLCGAAAQPPASKLTLGLVAKYWGLVINLNQHDRKVGMSNLLGHTFLLPTATSCLSHLSPPARYLPWRLQLHMDALEVLLKTPDPQRRNDALQEFIESAQANRNMQGN
jgi:hypothetical protein